MQMMKIKDNLVEFSVKSLWAKLFKKVLELQSINGHNLSASSLPAITETSQRNGFVPFHVQQNNWALVKYGDNFS